MELLGVRLELPANNPVVLLRELGGDRRVLPIYIGPEEAKSIALALEGVTTPRPMTHDLLRDAIEALGATVASVTVTELRDRTFYAELELHLAGAVHTVSSRPSDAIALAVRVDCPIYASDSVLDDAAAPAASDEPADQDQIIDEFREFIDQISPEDFES
jgi:uncharacterized protein